VAPRSKAKAKQAQAQYPKGSHSKYHLPPLTRKEKDFTSIVQDWDDLEPDEQLRLLDDFRQAQLDAEKKERQKKLDEMASIPGASGSSLPPAVPPAPVPPPTVQDCLDLINHIGLAVGNLAQQVTALTAQVAAASATRPSAGKDKEIVARPKAWDGKGTSTDARHFLAAFHNWAGSKGDSMNTWHNADSKWYADEHRWISAVLNLMEGDAKTWALPYLEQANKGTLPFSGSWQDFVTEFNRRFSPLDITDIAREELKKTKQSKKTVAEYVSVFEQYSGQTGWSIADLRTRFYDGLTDEVKDLLAITDKPQATYDELKKSAQTIDQRLRQRKNEKGGRSSSSNNTSSSDPNAMQVDATRQQGNRGKEEFFKTRAEYQNWMKGKCYGCGDKGHTKKDGNHERDVCNWCQKVGHRGPVCQLKKMGKPAKAKAAASTDSPGPPSSSSNTAAAAASSSTPAKTQQVDVAKLMELMKSQQEQLEALKAAF